MMLTKQTFTHMLIKLLIIIMSSSVMISVCFLCLFVTMNTLNFMTWNVTGIMSSSAYLCDSLKQYDIDICGISEHWLYPHNAFFLDNILTQYHSHVVCDKELCLPSKRKVGKGGVALLWHHRLDKYVVPLSIDDDRIAGLQLQQNDGNYLFVFQVYLPSANHTTKLYRDYVDKLYDLWYTYSECGSLIFLGDFNAKCSESSQVPRDVLLNNFTKDIRVVAANTLSVSTGASTTYVSYDNCYSTLIDYIVIPVELVE